MGERTHETDSIAMALLYRKRCTNSTMISYEKAKEFDRVINENLDEMGSTITAIDMEERDNYLFFASSDENGNVYAVMDPNADIDRTESLYIGFQPFDTVVASQQPNA